MPSNVRLAVQKSGRLSDGSLRLIQECGIEFQSNGGSSKLRSEAVNLPIELLFLRDDDIPGYVADGVADLGIVGENIVREKQQPVQIVEQLGFSRCRLALAVPRGSSLESVEDLGGCDIATSFPKILSAFLAKRNVSAKIHEISGSVEIAPSIGLARAVCDIVGSGSTLVSNGLREIETVLRSEAVLISHDHLSDEKELIVKSLLLRVRAVGKAKRNKYILLNAPSARLKDIIALLPGMKSPTVLPLALEGWNSVHAVLDEDRFWEIIEQLKRAGAQGILVIPIEKMIV